MFHVVSETLTINPEKMYFRRKSIFYNIDGPSSNHYYYKLRVQASSLFGILCIKLNHRILPNIFACHLLQTELKIRKRKMKLRQFTLCILSFCLISHEFEIMSTQNEACTFGPKSPKGWVPSIHPTPLFELNFHEVESLTVWIVCFCPNFPLKEN